MVTDERATATVVALRYDHGVLLAAGGPTDGSWRLDALYGRIALGACGSPSQVARMYRAGRHVADIRARYKRQFDVSSRTLTFAFASALTVRVTESEETPDVQLLVADVANLHQVTVDGEVIEVDRCAAIGADVGGILDELRGLARRDIDLEAACFVAVDVLGRCHADLELAGIDDRRVHRPFFRVPPDLVERARRSRSRAGEPRS